MIQPAGRVMETNYVVVVLSNNSGQEIFDKVICYHNQNVDKVQQHINLLSVVGYKAAAVEIPLEGFNATLCWDVFLAYALAHGVKYELALLGRECMRRAHEENWRDDLKAVCGLHDNGQSMIRLAASEPDVAHRLWSDLISHQSEKNMMGHKNE